MSEFELNALTVFDVLCRHAVQTANSGMRYADIKRTLNVPFDGTMKLRNALRKLRDKGLICCGEKGWQLDEKGLDSATFRETYEEHEESKCHDPSW